MKISTLALAVIVITTTAITSAASDVYSRGAVTIQIDPQYGAGNDWGSLFAAPATGTDNAAAPTYRSLAVAADGSAFVGNYQTYSILRLDPSGKPLGTFGREGSRDGEFRNRPTLHGVLDNKYVFTSEQNGRLSLFDLNGVFVKVIQIDYMPLQCVALRDNKIAIVGHVPYGDGHVRHIVAIKDITTEEERIVLSRVSSSLSDGMVSITTKSGLVSISGHSRNDLWIITRTPDGNLVAGSSGRPQVSVFSPDGSPLGEFAMDIERVKAPANEKEKLRESLRAHAASLTIDEQAIDKALNSASFSEYLPYMYSLMADADGNLLAYTYSDQQDSRSFQAYSLKPVGRLLGKGTLTLDRYEVNLNPRLGAMQFLGGQVYAVVTPKDGAGGPSRVIRGTLIAK